LYDWLGQYRDTPVIVFLVAASPYRVRVAQLPICRFAVELFLSARASNRWHIHLIESLRSNVYLPKSDGLRYRMGEYECGRYAAVSRESIDHTL